MDIKHTLPGDMEIILDEHDMEFMNQNGYCMDRNGLVGHDTKTWVRIDDPQRGNSAQIDGASDVTVYLSKVEMPVRIENENIDPFIDSDRGRVDHFFGEAGGIIVKASEA